MVEFIADSHIYLVDGMVVPSVSTILSATIFKDKYKDIPEHILARAAHFGTQVHEAIETSEWLHLSDEEYTVYERWLDLKREKNIVPIEFEKIVHYGHEYIGRFDMVADVDGVRALCDVKTTYNLDREYLSWQLSMYALAYGHEGRMFAIWLPKRKGAELVEIPRKSEQEILDLVRAYHDSCGQS